MVNGPQTQMQGPGRAKPNSGTQAEEGRSNRLEVPKITMPKGGGAIRGMGEKFAANPVTGSGSMTVPIATSPGRSGFGPQLSLSYDSGAGNGPFGFGWNLPLPAITRKTDKGLPQYRDAEESDVFILSGSEDLVPMLKADGARFEDKETFPGYTVHRYRPRIEGLFARIERWTNRSDPQDVCWRSISRDNITTWYGKTANSRIADPADLTHIFSWLISESYDDKGNAIFYRYKEEDSTQVNLSFAHERNRTEQSRSANRYLKRIQYGNKKPFKYHTEREELVQRKDWLFEVVFDYDDHDLGLPTPEDALEWPCRQDPFSSYRSGFEVRTYRLCQRVLMFHHFPELGSTPCLVRSTDFHYRYEEEPEHHSNPIYSFLESVTQTGYKRQVDGSYAKKTFPPLEFEYSQPIVHDEVREVAQESLENLPIGLDGSLYRWVDLDGEGIPGILSEQADGWYYKPNLSPVNIKRENGNERTEARFGPLSIVAEKPPATNINQGRQQLLDLAGDGQLDLVELDGPTPGFYERTKDERWHSFRPFSSLPAIDWANSNLRFVDLTGDAHADILITEDYVFSWHLSLAEAGFERAQKVHQALDEEKGPRLLFADGMQSVYLADMCGDGLTDILRIRNGDVCYWPNLGYGRFGTKVTMDNAPWFDQPDQFDQKLIRLADIDGSGTNDIIYLGRDGVQLYFNQSGNSWSQVHRLTQFPLTDNQASVMTADLLGNGTACLVWSSPLAKNAQQPLRYINLMGGEKPHLLTRTVNNLGAETLVKYAPSTRFYLADKLAGKPWITRLPFPVHCVEEITVRDKWRQTSFSTHYSYHHGYFDGIEREFRGFGRVEQVDVEDYGAFAQGNAASPYITDDKTLYQPPVKTVTWFHTGAFLDQEHILTQFQEEYFPHWLKEAGYSIDPDYAFSERALPEPDLIQQDLSSEEWREALRACKGMTLRQEVYELDVDALEESRNIPTKLFTTAYHNCQIRRIQPQGDNRYAVFLVTESEALTYHYELDLKEKILRPDPRIAHSLVLNTNEYGQPLQQAAVGYPRVRPFTYEGSSLPGKTEARIRRVQNELHLAYTEIRYTDDVKLDDDYRLRLPCEISTFEVTGIRPQDEGDRRTEDPWDDIYFTLDELRRFRLSERYQSEGDEVEEIPYHVLPDRVHPQKRQVEKVRTLYFHENLEAPLPLGELSSLGLPYETYQLALTDELLDAVLREKLEGLAEAGETWPETVQRILRSGGYHPWDGQWWMRSGIAGFAADAADHFYLPERYIDPFEQVTELTFDPYDLYIRQSSDPLGNTTSVEAFDFRVLAPSLVKDPNDNLSAIAFDTFGLPVGVAVMGKEGTESGDKLDDFLADLPAAEVAAFFTADDFDEAQARSWLGRATTRYLYSFGEEWAPDGSIIYGHHPAAACGLMREKHVHQLSPGEDSLLQVAFEYSDGLGQVLASKQMAEPEIDGGPNRWLASGKTILNNKGKPVKQYEPYFSESGHRFEEPREVGVTPIMYYDPVGRLLRAEQADGSYSRVEFSPWFTAAYDPNDTVLEPNNAWYADHSADAALPESRRAAQLTAVHAETPAITHLDSLGREVLAISHNRYLDDSGTPVDERYVTFTKLDAEGKPLWIRDARGNLVMQYLTPGKPIRAADEPDPANPENMPAGSFPCYDIAGNLLFQHSMDAGDRWMLHDVTGQPLYAWDSRNNTFKTEYDALRRPLSLELRNDTHTDWIVVSGSRYGDEAGMTPEREAEVKTHNLRGQVYRTYDQSGIVQNLRFDFKGNPLEVRRRLALEYESDIDWRTALALPPEEAPDSQLMKEIFNQILEYDALNRATRQYHWHQGVGTKVNVTEPTYNQRGLLAKQTVVLEAEKTEDAYVGGMRNEMVRNLAYNAKAQRLLIEYGNRTSTEYTYDPETFRLTSLITHRHSDGKTLQDLHYTYDPVGNIAEIKDSAQPRVFFNNFIIDACNRYTYDALYRLIRAEGREHAGQVRHNTFDNWHDCPFRKKYGRDEVWSWRNYTERYRYDSVGNILTVRHTAQGDSTNSWTRQYQYATDSNRLLATGMGSTPVMHYTDTPSLEYRYSYNVHGSMISLPHLSSMDWNFTEHLHHIARAAGTQGETGAECPDASLEAWYRYDAGKQRTRKRVVKQGGTVEERLYFGGVEIFRRYAGTGQLLLERETLHVMDDQQRIAMVEIRTAGTDNLLRQITRYQVGNHLGSASLELNEAAEVISYEEYLPYGSTAYQSVRSDIEVSRKRYRYTGMERDEESGLGYHGARYYIIWIGKWGSVDPAGFLDGLNMYCYGQNNPTSKLDWSGKTTTQLSLHGVTGGRSFSTGRPFISFNTTLHLEYPLEDSGTDTGEPKESLDEGGETDARDAGPYADEDHLDAGTNPEPDVGALPPALDPEQSEALEEGRRLGAIYGQFEADVAIFNRMFEHRPGGGSSHWERMPESERVRIVGNIIQRYNRLPPLSEHFGNRELAPYAQRGFNEGRSGTYRAAIWINRIRNFLLDIAPALIAGLVSSLRRAGQRIVVDLFSGRASQIRGAIGVDLELASGNGVRADAMRLPFRGGVVDDLIVTNPYMRGAPPGSSAANTWLPEAARVLRPGGRIIITGAVGINRFVRVPSAEQLQRLGLRLVQRPGPVTDPRIVLQRMFTMDGRPVPVSSLQSYILERIR